MNRFILSVSFSLALGLASALLPLSSAEAAGPRCLTDCTPRVGIVSAFGAEADILLAETTGRREHRIHGRRFTTGQLRGNRVVIVLSGVSMVNASMVTQQLLDHFRVERLVMSGIAGGIDRADHVGDVTVPDRWAMPMEVYWHAGAGLPSPCGVAGDLACLGLRLAVGEDGRPLPPFVPDGTDVPAGSWHLRQNHVLSRRTAPQGAFFFDYPVDAEMLAVAQGIEPPLQRCGPRATRADGSIDEALCVRQVPRLRVGGRGVSGTAFLANARYRDYLHHVLQARSFEMETAALAHVALANDVPYIAFRSLSDLAGGESFDAEAGALFTSGLAEANEAAVTLSFLEAWRRRPRR
ncbi:5'-methylthioadenosine/S-adenosylhomocysteine nucleosidase [Rhizobacter sp. LjRoot28]|uniref:5'-methylthioadenosine/S-adenosylhomocysteine nucleosidase n=1 Tax=Rhizobacter sp. LjRoot28 TaxID=3342309 RepID=UPI003ED117EB